MKKLFLSLVAVIVAATASYAQNTLVATLSHGEDITMFYGTYALQNAMNAAQNGDIINLTGGGFQATDITKAITLRGTGIDSDTPTRIIGEFKINFQDPQENPDNTYRISMEGIRCESKITMNGTFSSAQFSKCQFTQFYYNANIFNTLFVNCKITGDYCYLAGGTSVQYINSYVCGFCNDPESTAIAAFVNCIIRPRNNGVYVGEIRNSQLLNSVLFSPTKHYGSLPSTTMATNCISINGGKVFDNSQPNPNCSYVSNWSDLFVNFTGTYSDSQTFELTDEAKTTFLGNDGTEVGLYGGMLPYTSTPSYPQITKMNVANKATADGKLSVEIEVSAAE